MVKLGGNVTNRNRVKKGLSLAVLVLTGLLSVAGTAQVKQEKVILETDLGKITIALFADKAPVTVENFLQYVDNHFYDGTVFHRIVPGFVVQGGGYRFDYSKKETQPPIINESSNGLRNARGTLSMARTPNPDSATSQFYINLKNNFSLDAKPGKPGYTVFGQVIEGYSVVKQIEVQPQGKNKFFRNAPNDVIRILKAYRVDDNETAAKTMEDAKSETAKTES